MKKRIILGLCLSLILSLTACGNSDSTASSQNSEHVQNSSLTVSEIMESAKTQADSILAEESSKMAEESRKLAENESTAVNEESSAGETSAFSDVDIDLTIISGTMVYSQVSNMMYRPSDYIGMTIRMNGRYSYYHDPNTGMDYFACIVEDATACCANGIEFILTDDYVYPDDYPEIGSNITVVGVFDTYMEGNTTYCTLRNAILE